ncbi:uncharacterized protein [Drosophila takahashii]|uniref:uncharacterized protein n=1 Tax=Drosophila takahashii TaxID=29030 RepID=UPI001CF9177A|nr:uncharacterized protein LOC108068598 [Drosophila takahashii]
MSSQAADQAPNIRDPECWLRHPISAEDTMIRLALKYETSIGELCRANRMHWQDVLQTRHHIWVPLATRRNRDQECQSIPAFASPTTLPPHFYRQSAPNPNHLAAEEDPLLITTKIK